MIDILDSGSMSDGRDYVMISKSDWDDLNAFRVLLDFVKEQDPVSYREELKEVAKELAGELPAEYGHMIKRNPEAAKYLKAFNARKGRPEALTAPMRDFIASNTSLTARELYEHLRASYGYMGAYKTVQNCLGDLRRGKSKLERTIEI